MRRLAPLVFVGLLALVQPARADLEGIPYVVVSGDTASAIASRHGVSLDELRAWNDGVDLERLRVGQRLVVGRGRVTRHTVGRGETLSGLAERYGVSVAELVRWNPGLRRHVVALGRELTIYARRDEPPSASVGRVDGGSLAHGVRIPSHPAYAVRDPSRAWVTRETAAAIVAGLDAARAAHPTAMRVEIRDASLEHGGAMHDHHSHQSGRDVDIAYFRPRCAGGVCRLAWLVPSQLDAGPQWTLISEWLRRGVVEYVFVDRDLQAPLYRAARESGASRAELSHAIQYPRAEDVRYGVVRHIDRHRNHLHVRFTCAAHDEGCVPSDGTTGN